MVSAPSAPPASSIRSRVSEDRIRGLALVLGMVVVMWAIEAVDECRDALS